MPGKLLSLARLTVSGIPMETITTMDPENLVPLPTDIGL